jgi:TIR domain
MRRKIFISYNHQDSDFATKIALALASDSQIDVFIDKWCMGVGDSILDKIELGIDESAYLIAILSESSVQSSWVRTELKYAFHKEQEMNRAFILPLVIDKCKKPISVVDKVYIDFQQEEEYSNNIQKLINSIKEIEPFSKRVMRVINDRDYETPYEIKYFNEGKQLLMELAKYREMEIEENQKWLLWQFFHLILGKYKATIKLGKSLSDNPHSNTMCFNIKDSWNETKNQIILTEDEFNMGLWEGEADLIHNSIILGKDMQNLGSVGRLIFRSACNQKVSENPFLDSAADDMELILNKFGNLLDTYIESSKESFLYDFSRIVFEQIGHKVKFVIGKGSDNLCLALSHGMLNISCAPPSDNWVIFEIYNPFFRSLKYTHICPNHANYVFEADIDFKSAHSETILGIE